MADQFIGEVRAFPYTFAPQDWAFCNGQIISIMENQALFSIIGTYYGGDGRVTMGVPNLQGRIPVHFGQSPGIQSVQLGQFDGQPLTQLSSSQLPSHVHSINVLVDQERETTPDNDLFPALIPANAFYKRSFTPNLTMNESSINVSGSSSPHENRQPYLVMSYCIAVDGIYPPRN